MMGCSRDHAAEIDIYNKSYKEKMERIRLMKEQGNKAMKEFGLAAGKDGIEQKEKDEMLQKASYYYKQALLIFVYLIPENDQEHDESELLKMQCHLNQSLVYFKMPLKYDECLQELSQVLKIDPLNSKALYRKSMVLKSLGKTEESL